MKHELDSYHRKRDFSKTSEPRGGQSSLSSGHMFIVHKHAARRLHYDLRLEAGGVLKSWAVPKGPSYDPSEKRLAVHVEDHPIEYGDFEGIIEEGQYGAGAVMLWDKGIWQPVGDWEKGLNNGKLTFKLKGRKLKGEWSLVRMNKKQANAEIWLLIKHHDREVHDASSYDITEEEPLSVKTGRSIDEIRSQVDEIVENKPESREKNRIKAVGRKAPWPGSFTPQLPTLVSHSPKEEQWLNEIKFDGYRLIAMIKKGSVSLLTRGGQDWTVKFPSIAHELSKLPIENGILDGEVAVQDPDGTTSFQKLQNVLKNSTGNSLFYYVFDLPYLNGHDLTGLPLIERKNTLEELVRNYQNLIPSVHFSTHITGNGDRIFQAACAHGAEGIVSKRSDSPYVQKRSQYWVKVKCKKRQEFVVGGYTDPKGARSYFGSLMLGYYDEKRRLIYCGNVGTGFNAKSIHKIYDTLKKWEKDDPDFDSPIDSTIKRHAHWTAPRMVVEIEFSGWTDEEYLRHPSFSGIREDKNPEEVVLEKEILPPGTESLPDENTETRIELPVNLTNPGKVLYPEQGLTKKDLAEYYLQIADWILPEIAGRPLSIVRCPEGIGAECFFQKHLGDQTSKWIKAVPIQEKGKMELYPVVDDVKGLLSLVQLGALEIHMWGCRRDHLEFPDRIIFDLDPSPEISKRQLIEATLFFRGWLMENNLRPFLKTTGGNGIHLVIPLKPSLNWDDVKNISKSIAQKLASLRPDIFTALMTTKAKRKGRILIDYMRNNRGSTSILPYSTRARPGAPVALPISIKELTEDFLSRTYNVTQVIHRLKKLKRDPWKGLNRP
jgi:bifunctional non-homologous end joining protein LigD